MTTAQISAQTIEAIWSAGGPTLDAEGDYAAAVLVIRHRSLGMLCSGVYGSVKGARKAARTTIAKREYVTATYLVTRGRGESYEVEAL